MKADLFGNNHSILKISLKSDFYPLGGSLVKFMVDTGADVTILSEGSANAVKFNRDLQGVAGSSSAPLYNVRLRVETPPFPVYYSCG